MTIQSPANPAAASAIGCGLWQASGAAKHMSLAQLKSAMPKPPAAVKDTKLAVPSRIALNRMKFAIGFSRRPESHFSIHLDANSTPIVLKERQTVRQVKRGLPWRLSQSENVSGILSTASTASFAPLSERS